VGQRKVEFERKGEAILADPQGTADGGMKPEHLGALVLEKLELHLLTPPIGQGDIELEFRFALLPPLFAANPGQNLIEGLPV
jgi:hypothetical protein